MTHHLRMDVKDLISFLDALCKNYKTTVSTTASSNLQTKSLTYIHIDTLIHYIAVIDDTENEHP